MTKVMIAGQVKGMKKTISILLTMGLVIALPLMSFGTESQAESSADSPEVIEAAAGTAAGEVTETEAAGAETAADYTSAAESVILIDEPEAVTTSHSAMINGQQVDYEASVGSLIFSNGQSECEMFYTAYTRTDTEDVSTRPITFAYNGGPGAASACVNLLFIGPRTLELDEKGNSLSLPSTLVDNENSLLDLTDLVIIDAIGTGYSRALEGTDPADFYGYDQDRAAIGNFIWLYINSKERWTSPKYLLGESYGTTRSMGVCEYLLGAYYMPLNGLIQVSSIHDAAMFQEPNEDSSFARFLPTYAADAWVQGKVSETYQSMELEEFLEEVRTFTDTEYISALSRGESLTDEEFNAIADKVSGYTGLDVEFVKNADLRIGMTDFCVELLKDQKLVVGRMDGRVTGPLTSGNIGDGSNDPSFKDVTLELGGVTNQYYNDELGYHSDVPYLQMNIDINMAWTFPGDSIFSFNQSETIYNNICNNRFMKVWVLCGYYDLATPFHNAEWIYNHLFLNDDCKDQVQFTYYKGGHMFYLDNESHAQFHKDAEAWFNSAAS